MRLRKTLAKVTGQMRRKEGVGRGNNVPRLARSPCASGRDGAVERWARASRGGDQAAGHSILDEFGRVLYMKMLHHGVLMKGNRSRRHI